MRSVHWCNKTNFQKYKQRKLTYWINSWGNTASILFSYVALYYIIVLNANFPSLLAFVCCCVCKIRQYQYDRVDLG